MKVISKTSTKLLIYNKIKLIKKGNNVLIDYGNWCK